MAEYYAVLKRAVGSLDGHAVDARRAVYDKARNALIGQLKAVDPPLTTAEISRQRLELEEAIRKVEREAASAPPMAAPSRPLPAVPMAQRNVAPSRAPQPMAPATVAEAPMEPGEPSPQDVFRRAIEEAQSRGYAAGAAAVERPPMRADAGSYNNPPPEMRSSRERMPPAVPPPPLSRDEPPPPRRRQEQAYEPPERAEPEPRLAPEYDQEWEEPQQRQQRPALAADSRDRPAYAPPSRTRSYVEEDDHEVVERKPRRSRLPSLLLLVLIIAMVGGLAALAYSQRGMINSIIAGFDSEASKPAAAAKPTADAAAGKNTDRLLEGGDTSAPAAKDVRTVTPEAPAVADSGDAAQPAADSAPADTAAPADSSADAATAPAAVASADSGDATPASTDATGAADNGQKAILYEEPLDSAGGGGGVTAISAAVTWRFVDTGANGPEVEADLTVPERNMKVRFTLHKNTDATLPASHLIEVVVDTAADFPGKGIKSVPRVVMKPTEEARGQALVGAPAKVTDGFFWVALSAADTDVTANLALLQERNWIDLPFVYDTGQRAILTFEKGPAGDQAFQKAMNAWKQS